jgi:hypothetical protein
VRICGLPDPLPLGKSKRVRKLLKEKSRNFGGGKRVKGEDGTDSRLRVLIASARTWQILAWACYKVKKIIYWLPFESNFD